MAIAYFEAVGGAAGDMILGALIDAGLDIDVLAAELGKLEVGGYSLRCEAVMKRGVRATQFHVVAARSEAHFQHDDGTEDTGHRADEFAAMISKSDIGDRARNTALRIVQRYVAAISAVRGLHAGDVCLYGHDFVDSVVDIVGSAIALDVMDIRFVYCSPLPMGVALIQGTHGPYSIPAAETVQLLSDVQAPQDMSTVNCEQVTPTGAAILSTLAEFRAPRMRADRIGIGAGQAELAIPNVLRVYVGEVQETAENDHTT